MARTLKPGASAPKSGQYRMGGTRVERTVVRDDPLPPTPKPGQGYTLLDKTKHKR